MLIRALLVLFLIIAGMVIPGRGTAAEEHPKFSQPIDCTVGNDCWVMQYFDHEEGPGWEDYTCNKRSYNDHTGTDIALSGLAAMKAGVDVQAAADGVVVATREGMPDQPVEDPNDPKIRAVGCGNAVVVEHPGGWRSAYCHLRKGSVAVHQGDRVTRGQVVAKVGLSGLTEFPHLDFSVVKDGHYVDPFQGLSPTKKCGLGENNLWTKEAAQHLAYRPVDARLIAFLQEAPQDWKLLRGVAPLERMEADTRQPLVLSFQLIGSRSGDQVEIVVHGPEGTLAHQSLSLSSDRILVNASLPLGEGPWAAGTYEATVTVRRPDQDFSHKWTRQLVVEGD